MMIYLAANNSGVYRLRREGWNVGWCQSPGGLRCPVKADMSLPWAMDNGLYHPPDSDPHPPSSRLGIYEALSKAIRLKWPAPLFAVAPDIPYRGQDSLELSLEHLPVMKQLFPGIRIACAVQDGMERWELQKFVKRFDAVFVAGSTDWKLCTGSLWVGFAHSHGMWAHVARVNSGSRIRLCVDWHADSCDGTGIWRGNKVLVKGVLNELVQNHLFRNEGIDTTCNNK